MIQEYLIIGKENLKDNAELKICDAEPEIDYISNSDCVIVRYIKNGENEETAKLLSEINDTITKSFIPLY